MLPVYETEGEEYKGPRLLMARGRDLVAPDMLAFRAGRILWIEAKHKTVFSWHRKTSRWVTGIDMHQYSQYQQVAKVHPIPLWLLFLHQQSVSDGPGPCPTGLYGQRIDVLKGCENHRHENWGKSGMVYWGESSLKKMAELRDMGL